MKTRAKSHILLVISGLALATAPGYAQTDGPLPISWQMAYGAGKTASLGSAVPYDFVQTADGGFLLAGSTDGPANGIRTEPICGLYDAWVIKIDAQGQRLWDKSYGGESNDGPMRILLNPDGGYLLAGLSYYSPAGCLKTAGAKTYPGYADYWVVRCDAEGNALWDKSYLPEGTVWSWPNEYEQTPDGSIIACGHGYFPQSVYYEIFKLDPEGQQLWSTRLGCPIIPTPSSSYTRPQRVRETPDGGFIVAAANGEQPCPPYKTSPSYGGSNGYMGSDVWVVRVDAQGNQLWDQSYGGTNTELATDLHLTSDGGYVVFGSSRSLPAANASKGTKTSRCYGNMDYWIIRIGAQGEQLWDKSYGGGSHDVLTYAEPMPDGGWLLCGQSASSPHPEGGKTAPKFGSWDFWILRLDEQGNRLWDQSFGGTAMEGFDWIPEGPPWLMRAVIKHTADGGFLLTGTSKSPVSGTKTAPLIGLSDYWVLK
ncbi:MAG TPA: hypothetical protein PK640_15580, partial [Verrucomicrobiota bacterium]|nr:hypothetical protein [Verrucomicrobiota bacterium]